MNARFWLIPLFFVLICVGLAFLTGASFTQVRSAKLEQSSLKKSIKRENSLYLKQISDQLDSLITESENIQNTKQISADSPFFALVILHAFENEQVYTHNESLPLHLKDQAQITDIFEKGGTEEIKDSAEHIANDTELVEKKEVIDTATEQTTDVENPDEKKTEIPTEETVLVTQDQAKETEKKELNPQTRDLLLELAHKTSGPLFAEQQNTLLISSKTTQNELKTLKVKGQKSPLIVFIKTLKQGQTSVAFLKNNSDVFKLQSDLADIKNKDVFLINSQGRLFFHTKPSKIFKILSKKSPLWNSLKEMIKHPHPKSRYLTFQKTMGKKDIYYLQKETKGDLFLISKVAYPLPFLAWGESYLLVFLFFIFGLVFLYTSVRIFRLAFAYNFLKQAILSFDKTNWFPVSDIPKNPLLYFYNNRQDFLNQKNRFQDQQIESKDLTFQEVIQQELKKTKSKFSRLIVKKDFSYDVKLFGFERFLRSIIHELLQNALESMGGLAEPKVDLSIKKDNQNLVFSIRDYGAGVTNKDFKKCFRLYYSTKTQLGVGLNVVQSIIQSNEGTLELFTPKEGTGLKVTIYFPLKCFLKNHYKKVETEAHKDSVANP